MSCPPIWQIKDEHGRWLTVSHWIFRSWSGERRKNGKPYRGKVFILGTKEVSKCRR